MSEAGSISQRISALLPKSVFARQVLVMGGGTAVVQALGVLVSPILTRLYTPADFGLMAAFMSVSSIAVVFATLRYDVAISVAANDADALRLLLVSLLLPLFVGLVVLVMLLALPSPAYRAISSDTRFFTYRWFLSLAIAGGGLYNALVGWSVRRKAFRELSVSRVFQTSSSISVQLVVGVLHGGVIGLILGSLLSMTSGIGNLWRQAYGSIRSAFVTGEWRGLRRTAVAYHRYPVYIVWNALMNTASLSAPPIILSAMFTSDVAGQYALSYRILQLPATLIASAVAGVFLSRAAELRRSGTLAVNIESVAKRLSLFASIVLLPMVFFGPNVFSVVFGQSWQPAGRYSQYLMPWLYLGFVFSPLTATVLVMEKQSADTAWQLAILATRVGSLLLGGHFGGPKGAVVVFAFSSFTIITLYFGWMLRIGGANVINIVTGLCRDILTGLILTGLCWLLYSASGRSAVLVFLPWIVLALFHHRRVRSSWRST